MTPHVLRHTFASRLVKAGVDLRTVQELGGWSSLAMVQRYSHPDEEHKLEAVQRLGAFPMLSTIAKKDDSEDKPQVAETA
jgi:site-specific recombinase XerD